MTHKPENKIETEICKEEIVEGGNKYTKLFLGERNKYLKRILKNKLTLLSRDRDQFTQW